MTSEIALLIFSGLSFAFAVYQGVVNMKRDRSTDDKKEAVDMTTVIVKLEYIGTGISEIKADMQNTKDEMRQLRDRVIKAEDSIKSAHRRINELHFSPEEVRHDE